MLVPSFAVERTQELISDLARLVRDGELPEIPIYIDSPLASKATHVFAAHASALQGGAELIRGLHSPQVRFTESVEESKALDRLNDFHIVIHPRAGGAAYVTQRGCVRIDSCHLRDRLRRAGAQHPL
jgi:metallo-beta-lactamase family protein